MAAPAQRAVSGARRERNSNKHKRLFLPGEPGGLMVGTGSRTRSPFGSNADVVQWLENMSFS